MDKLKQYVAFTVLGCLLVLAAGWFLLVSPKRSQAADLRSQAAAQVSANSQLQNQLAVLKAQAKELPKQQAKLAAVAAKIPDNPALPALIRALTTAATSAGVELVSVTPGTPAVAAATASGGPVAPAAGAAATARSAPGASSGAAAGQLAVIPLNLNVVGGYFQVEQFVSNLETLQRAMRMSSISIAPGANPLKPGKGTSIEDGKSLAGTITAQVFMAANRQAPTAVTVPGQPAVTPVGPAAPVTPAKK